jgi:hypothetical protein
MHWSLIYLALVPPARRAYAAWFPPGSPSPPS